MFKPIDPESSITLICIDFDPAVDREKSDIKGYLEVYIKEPHRWPEFIKPKDGMKLTVFRIGVISPAMMARLEDDSGMGRGNETTIRWNTLNWESFCLSLRDIQDGPTTPIPRKDDPKKFTEGVPKYTRNDVEYVDPSWLSEVCVGPLYQAACYIGGVAYRWQTLVGDDSKNS